MTAIDSDVLFVLLIEDNEGDRRLTEIALREGAGELDIRCRVESMATLSDGVAYLDNAVVTPDAVLLDLELPDASDLDGLRAVRKANPHLPIVVLTGRSDLETAAQALKVGAGDYIDKGEVQPRTLLRSIRYAVERKKSEAELTRLAQTDPLTGLLNRRAFFERLQDALIQARRSERACAVIMFDIDRFKEVNDVFGHKTGDDLLTTVAVRLRQGLRASDTCGRIGGDEFAILAPNLKFASDAMEIANKITGLVSSIDEVNGKRIDPHISVGISVFPMDDSPPEVLVSHADMAMYKSKTGREGAINFYDAGMDASVKRRHALRCQMREDIGRSRFFLLFQPIMDAVTHRAIGAEGLARWRDLDGGIIEPDRFIPLAEESGDIVELGSCLLQEACRHIRRCAEHNLPCVPISLNVSTVQCRDPTFGLRLIAAIESFQIPPSVINVEITESTVIKNLEATRDNLRLLRQSGVGVHMDDFGTGYSSLALLRELPLDALKIDRTFVRDVGKVAGTEAIVRAIVDLCKRLGFSTIAEGVETKEQADLLRDIGVTGMQGFYFSRPIPAQLLNQFLDQPRALSA